MVTIKIRGPITTVEAKYLKVEAAARYWEDATVNGVDDEDGSAIPFRSGGCWCPVIDIDAGVIEGWPKGTTADIHYKVCDAGRYALLDADKTELVAINGWVPKIMCPAEEGYGDYIDMSIDGDGKIANWSADLSPFSADHESMPRYQSHKKVWALEIKEVFQVEGTELETSRLAFADAGYAPRYVSNDLFAGYYPQRGDFFVVYDDGYQSISQSIIPRKPFLDDYTKL